MKNVFYRADWLCAFNPSFLHGIGISRTEVLESLQKMGYRFKTVDIAGVARLCVNSLSYRQSASQGHAPGFVNCRTYLAWVYAQLGILVSALSLSKAGNGDAVALDGMISGDLVFVSDRNSPSGGHVGMATSCATVIHAQIGVDVQEVSIEKFLEGEKLRRVVRVADDLPSLVTVQCNCNPEIICSADFESLIRRNLGK